MNLSIGLSFGRFNSFLTNPFSKLEGDMDIFMKTNPISILKLEEAGFECVSSNITFDEVVCRECGLKRNNWSGDEKPWNVHRTLSPNCPFLNPSKKPLEQPRLPSNEFIKKRQQLFPQYDILAKKFDELKTIQLPFKPLRGGFLLLFESFRLLEFPSCQNSKEAAIFAKAGFVYDRKLDCCVCVFCNLEVPFTYQEKTMLEIFHETKSPLCPFSSELEVGNISIEEEHRIKEKARNTFLLSNLANNESNEKYSYSMKHPEFIDLHARHGTFKSWPELQNSEYSADLMADCGFYYKGRP